MSFVATQCSSNRQLSLHREVVFAPALAINICRATVQSASKGVGVAEIDFDDFHASLALSLASPTFDFATQSNWSTAALSPTCTLVHTAASGKEGGIRMFSATAKKLPRSL